ncbi:MAG: hypothetical protein M1364_03745 [Candidatus Marsarchaeota archaeon]|jgi:hypothetical protein|nr:hypothetical protein [Candidatus Marsarchaeota archaeon]
MAAGSRAERKAKPVARRMDNTFTYIAMGSLIFAIVVIAAYAFEASYSYSALKTALGAPTIIAPPIEFYVNSSPANLSGISYVPLNQTFCPENLSIQKAGERDFTFNYYTTAKPGEIFNYSLTFNSSSSLPSVLSIYVFKPFRLLGYRMRTMGHSNCGGYPNATDNLTMTIQAPNSTFVGKYFSIIYSKGRV